VPTAKRRISVAAAGNGPDEQLGDADAPVARVHHPVVAGAGQDAAPGDRVPVDGGDDRQRAGEHGQERLAERGQELLEVSGAAIAQRQQVHARREDVPVPGQDDGTVAVAFQFPQAPGQSAAQARVERVRPPVRHRDHGHLPAGLDADHNREFRAQRLRPTAA
jgi:hypothetical protein